MASSRKRLGELLVAEGALDPMQLNSALGHQRQWGGQLGAILLEQRFVSEKQLVHALSKQLNFPPAFLDESSPERSALRLVDAELAEKMQVLPLRIEADGRAEVLVVAIANPADLGVLDELQFRTRKRIKPHIAGPRDMARAIRRHYFGEESTPIPSQDSAGSGFTGSAGFFNASFPELELPTGDTPSAPLRPVSPISGNPPPPSATASNVSGTQGPFRTPSDASASNVASVPSAPSATSPANPAAFSGFADFSDVSSLSKLPAPSNPNPNPDPSSLPPTHAPAPPQPFLASPAHPVVPAAAAPQGVPPGYSGLMRQGQRGHSARQVVTLSPGQSHGHPEQSPRQFPHQPPQQENHPEPDPQDWGEFPDSASDGQGFWEGAATAGGEAESFPDPLAGTDLESTPLPSSLDAYNSLWEPHAQGALSSDDPLDLEGMAYGGISGVEAPTPFEFDQVPGAGAEQLENLPVIEPEEGLRELEALPAEGLESNLLESSDLDSAHQGSGHLDSEYLDSGLLGSGHLSSEHLGSEHPDTARLDAGRLEPEAVDAGESLEAVDAVAEGWLVPTEESLPELEPVVEDLSNYVDLTPISEEQAEPAEEGESEKPESDAFRTPDSASTAGFEAISAPDSNLSPESPDPWAEPFAEAGSAAGDEDFLPTLPEWMAAPDAELEQESGAGEPGAAEIRDAELRKVEIDALGLDDIGLEAEPENAAPDNSDFHGSDPAAADLGGAASERAEPDAFDLEHVDLHGSEDALAKSLSGARDADGLEDVELESAGFESAGIESELETVELESAEFEPELESVELESPEFEQELESPDLDFAESAQESEANASLEVESESPEAEFPAVGAAESALDELDSGTAFTGEDSAEAEDSAKKEAEFAHGVEVEEVEVATSDSEPEFEEEFPPPAEAPAPSDPFAAPDQEDADLWAGFGAPDSSSESELSQADQAEAESRASDPGALESRAVEPETLDSGASESGNLESGTPDFGVHESAVYASGDDGSGDDGSEVSGSEVSGSELSGSEVSGSEVSGSEVSAGSAENTGFFGGAASEWASAGEESSSKKLHESTEEELQEQKEAPPQAQPGALPSDSGWAGLGLAEPSEAQARKVLEGLVRRLLEKGLLEKEEVLAFFREEPET